MADPDRFAGSGAKLLFQIRIRNILCAGTGVIKNWKTKIQRVVDNLKNLMLL